MFSISDSFFDGLFLMSDYGKTKIPEDFHVEIPFPGLTKEDLSIELVGKELIIQVQAKESSNFTKRYRNYYFTKRLADYHDLDKIEARMDSGLLTITAPIKKNDKSGVIEIKIK